MDQCAECEGKGYCWIESGLRGYEIQRCDTCAKFESDDAARRQYRRDTK